MAHPEVLTRWARPRGQHPRARELVVGTVLLLLALEVAAHLITMGPVLGRVLAGVSVLSAVAVAATRGHWLSRRGADRLVCTVVLVNVLGPLAASGNPATVLPLLAAIIAAGGLLPPEREAPRWVLIGLAAGTVVAVSRFAHADTERLLPPLLIAAALALVVAATRTRAQRAATTQIETLQAAQAATASSERAYRDLFDRSPVGIGVLDERGTFTAANEALCRTTGRRPGQLLGQPAAALLDVVAGEAAHDDTSSTPWGRRQVTRPDGSTRTVEVSTSSGVGPTSATPDVVVLHVRDVTEQVQAEDALRRARADLTAIAAVVRQMASGDDVRTAIVEATRDIAGASTAYLLEPDGRDLVVTVESGSDLLGLRVPMDSVSITTTVWATGEAVFLADPAESPLVSPALLQLSGARSFMWQPVTVGGTVRALLLAQWATRVSDLDDRAAQAVALLAAEAATALERESLLESLRERATTDPLTGLANRRSWDEALSAAMDRAVRAGGSFAVSILDVDHFKAYNDQHGHGAGDDLLRAYGAAASAAVREIDLVARWGGEEFAVLLDGCTDSLDAAVAAERVRCAAPAPVTISAGVAVWDGVETAHQLLTRADASLYRAKTAGRDQTVVDCHRHERSTPAT